MFMKYSCKYSYDEMIQQTIKGNISHRILSAHYMYILLLKFKGTSKSINLHSSKFIVCAILHILRHIQILFTSNFR